MKKKTFKLIVNGFSILISLIFYSNFGHAEVSFLAMGDSPYSNEEYYLIDKELKNIPKSTKFIIHLGDIRRKEKNCGETDYRDFRDLLKQSPVPVFVIPGDNGYDVCENKLKAKKFWDQYVSEFEKHWKLEFKVKRQKKQSENFSFLIESTLFIGVNLFEKRDRDTVKFNKILKNNISWIKENLKKYQEQTKSLVVFAHDFSGLRNEDHIVCNVFQSNSWEADQYYKIFSDDFVSLANEFKKPILYMQGNYHCWVRDFPYKEAKNIERIVVAKIEKKSLVQITVKKNKFKVDQRKNKRINFFFKEANLGDVWSQYFLGKEYLKVNDYKNAMKWLTNASSKEFIPAEVELGIMLNEEKKYDQAIKIFQLITQRQTSQNINSNVQFNKKKHTSSVEFRISEFKNQIIKNKFFESFFHLGVMLSHGFSVPINYIKALEHFKKAAENNIGAAYTNIAKIYYSGLGVKRNFKEVKYWCLKGSATGVKECSHIVGTIYLMGQGVEQNYKAAAKWFKLANNYPPSLYNLGILHLEGLGVKHDKKIAISYFKKAAMLGSKEAIKVLDDIGIVQISGKFANTP
jgi:TPR repeat protein